MELIFLISWVLPLVLFIVLFVAMPNCSYNMDPYGVRGMFLGIIPLYHRVFHSIELLSFFGILLAGYLHAYGVVVPLFASIIYGVAFSGMLVFFYEGYAAKPSSYTLTKHAIVLSLGISSLLFFVAGEIGLAVAIMKSGL